MKQCSAPRPLARLNRSVRVFPLEEVTSRNRAVEAAPMEIGISSGAVERIWRTIEDLYLSGSYPAVAFCLRRHGKVVVDGAIGHARGNGRVPDGPLVPATPETLFNLFSASKAITAMVLHPLDDLPGCGLTKSHYRRQIKKKTTPPTAILIGSPGGSPVRGPPPMP